MSPDQIEVTSESGLIDGFRRLHREIVDSFYQEGVKVGGRPVEFRLFDRETCGQFDSSWLIAQVQDDGLSAERLRKMISSGIIPKWSDSRGNEGFLLYTPEQVKVVKELDDSGRYSTTELKHIVEKWNETIECSLEVIPYDELGGTDFEVYRGHVEREVTDLLRHKHSLEKYGADASGSARELEKQLAG
jgi:hypothetical protein